MSRCTFHGGEIPMLPLSPASGSLRPKSEPRDVTEVLVVEHRDEVFARIQADLAAWGIQVQRAISAEEARRLYYRRPLELVLTHTDLPDETGWLFACKLRIVWPSTRLWIYTPWWTAKEQVLAEFVGAEEILGYGGDLQRLAAEILDRLVTSSFPLPPPLTLAVGLEDRPWG